MDSLLKWINLQDFIAGWVAGVAALAIGHPLDTIKVRQQVLHSNLLRAIIYTLRYEGVSGFYKGVIFPSFMIGPSNAIFFGLYGNCLNILQGGPVLPTRTHEEDVLYKRNIFIAGVAAGCGQVLISCPSEVVKTMLQMQTKHKTLWNASFESSANGIFDCIRQIFAMRGIRGFYRGLTPMFLRDVPTSGIYTLTYEVMKNWDYRNEILNYQVIRRTIAGGTAGVFSWVVVIPFDVIKSQMQGDDPQNPKYANTLDCAIKTYKEGGWRRFTKGTMAVLIRAFPCNAGIFVSYDYALDFFKNYKILEPKYK